MDRNDIKNMLAKQFDSKMDAFLKKRADYNTDLEKDLSHLKVTYGEEIINTVITKKKNPLEVKTPNAPAALGHAVTPNLNATTSIPSPVSVHKRTRRRSRKVRGAIGFSELKPKVVEAVNTLAGRKFTIQDVKKVLNEKKVKFQLEQLHLILPKYISGIEVVDKQKRHGLAMNVYEIKGTVALVDYTTSTTKK